MIGEEKYEECYDEEPEKLPILFELHFDATINSGTHCIGSCRRGAKVESDFRHDIASDIICCL